MQQFAIFSSAGNDSVAVLSYFVIAGIPQAARVSVVYQDTGWAHPDWPARVERIAAFCKKFNMSHVTLTSMGFERLVEEEGNRKGEPPERFPTGREKFCTRKLKILPAQKWLTENDPQKVMICVNGVRRCESERRTNAPVYTPFSPDHLNRPLWSPLAEYSDEQRDQLLRVAGFEPLPHRSEECEPCIFSSRQDLRRVTPGKVDRIRALEARTGKVMFRPRAYAGATGIDEVMRWAWSERGQYRPEDAEVEQAILDDGLGDCESGWCGA